MSEVCAAIPLMSRTGELLAWTIVDACLFSELSDGNWYLSKHGYAARSVGHAWPRKCLLLHRRVMLAVDDEDIDHENRDRLDNRRSNLRRCNASENICNAKTRKDNTSGSRGVSWCKNSGTRRAYITKYGHTRHLGKFKNKQDAIDAYKTHAELLHGRFAAHLSTADG